MSESITLDDDVWPQPHSVDRDKLSEATTEEVYLRHAFELLKESAILLSMACSIHSPGDASGFDRNRAVIMGHLVRMTKLARTALHVSGTYRDGEQLIVLSRLFIDSATTIAYVLELGRDSTRFDAYVNDSLISENEFLKVIERQVKARGGTVLPIEERMRRSIAESFRLAGVQAETLPRRDRRAWPSVEQRIGVLGPTAYVAYRGGSNCIHGGWSDIEKNHLTALPNGGFAPNLESTDVRPQPLLMMSGVSLSSVHLYLSSYMDSAMAHFRSRLEDLDSRIRLVDEEHERFLNRDRT